jgi:hypothetical protein
MILNVVADTTLAAGCQFRTGVTDAIDEAIIETSSIS